MNIHQSWGNFYAHSGKLSDVVRQLSFAGIAVVWIFRSKDSPHIQGDFQVALLWLVAALAVDAVQYFYLSAAWLLFSRKKENELLGRLSPKEAAEQIFVAPGSMNVPAYVLLFTKATLLVVGYVYLGLEVLSRF